MNYTQIHYLKIIFKSVKKSSNIYKIVIGITEIYKEISKIIMKITIYPDMKSRIKISIAKDNR